jgi:transcriptional regulator with XRE-family HTH domain
LQEKTIKQIIADNISRLRKKAGFKSQLDFAKKIDVSKTTVWNYENGVNFFPLEKVPMVVEVLHCTVNDLFSPLFDKVIGDEELSILLQQLKEIRNDPIVKEVMKKFITKVYNYLGEDPQQKGGDAQQRANG